MEDNFAEQLKKRRTNPKDIESTTTGNFDLTQALNDAYDKGIDHAIVVVKNYLKEWGMINEVMVCCENLIFELQQLKHNKE